MNNSRNLFLKTLEQIYSADNYIDAKPFPHCVVENILDEDFAIKCQQEIMSIPAECGTDMTIHLRKNTRYEIKITCPMHVLDYLIC